MSSAAHKLRSFVAKQPSQAAVARQLRMDRTLLNHVLHGRRRPSFAVAVAIENLTSGWIRAAEWAPAMSRRAPRAAA